MLGRIFPTEGVASGVCLAGKFEVVDRGQAKGFAERVGCAPVCWSVSSLGAVNWGLRTGVPERAAPRQSLHVGRDQP